MAASISIENLLTTLKGLQKEKACLGQKLQEMKCQKVHLQDQNRNFMGKLNQLKEMNAKMEETLSVAKHKVQHTLVQEKRIQGEIDARRAIQHRMNAEMDRIKEKDMEDIEKFQQNLSDLAQRFIDARQYYRPENLEKEVSVLAGQREVLLTEKSERDTDTEAMISQLEQIKLGKEHTVAQADQLSIPSSQQQTVLCELQTCTAALSSRLGEYRGKQAAMAEKLQQVKTKLKQE